MHRETLARLLWPHANGLQNLRVELSSLRKQGIELGPTRSPVLSFAAQLDLHFWQQPPQDPDSLLTQLKYVKGLPLTELDPLGSPALERWLAEQQPKLAVQLQTALQACYHREIQANHNELALEIGRTAATLGWTVSAPPEKNQPFDWLAEQVRNEFNAALNLSHKSPHLLLYLGRHASGRRETLKSLTEQTGALTISIEATKSSSVLIASAAMQLRSNSNPEISSGANQLLLHPTEPEADLIRLGLLLERAEQPVIIQIFDASSLSTRVIPLLDYMMNWTFPVMLVLISTPSSEQTLLRLLGHHVHPKRLSFIHAPALVPGALPSSEEGSTAEHSLEIIRQSEGWWPAAQMLLQQPPPIQQRMRLQASLRQTLLAEITMTSREDQKYLAVLSALPMPFTELMAYQALQENLNEEQTRQIIDRAIYTGILERMPQAIDVQMPEHAVHLVDGRYPLTFTSELQRSALMGTVDVNLRATQRHKTTRQQGGSAAVEVEVQPAVPRGTLLCRPSSSPVFYPGELEKNISLPCGYRLLTGELRTVIMRLGAAGHDSPLLTLCYPSEHEQQPWNWRFSFRILKFQGKEEHFPLEVTAGQQPLHLPTELWQNGQAPTQSPPTKLLKQAEWYLAWGSGTGKELLLRVWATNLTVEIANIQITPHE